MKNNFLALFLLIYLGQGSWAQNTRDKSFSDTQRITYEQLYVNESKSDPWNYVFKQGPWAYIEQLYSREFHNALNKNACYLFYYDSAYRQILACGNANGGLQIGQWSMFYPNGKLYSTENFVLGKREGLVRYFNHLGQLYATYNYTHDTLNGRAEFFGLPRYRGKTSSIEEAEYAFDVKRGFEIWENGIMVTQDIYYGFTDDHNLVNPEKIEIISKDGNVLYRKYNDPLEQIEWEKRDTLWKLEGTKLLIYEHDSQTSQYSIFLGNDHNEYISGMQTLKSKLASLHLHKNINFIYMEGQSQKFLKFIYAFKIPKSLKNVQEIWLSVSGLNKIPNFVYQCKSLQKLAIYTSKLNKNRTRFDHLPHIAKLNIHTDIVPDWVLPQVAKMKGLKSLQMNIYDTSFNNKNLELLKQIVTLSIHIVVPDSLIFNSLYPIPDEVFQLTQLEYFCNAYYGKSFDENYKIMLQKLPNCSYFPFGLGCFAPQTQIVLGNGYNKNIEEVKIGDVLLTWNQTLNGMDTTQVTKVFKHKHSTETCYAIRYIHNSDTIILTVTHHHPFLTADGQQVLAGTLKAGDELYCVLNNKLEAVNILSIEKTTIPSNTVYNLETTKHTYLAGSIWVHNK